VYMYDPCLFICVKDMLNDVCLLVMMSWVGYALRCWERAVGFGVRCVLHACSYVYVFMCMCAYVLCVKFHDNWGLEIKIKTAFLFFFSFSF
jgi:hypothetical protein